MVFQKIGKMRLFREPNMIIVTSTLIFFLILGLSAFTLVGAIDPAVTDNGNGVVHEDGGEGGTLGGQILGLNLGGEGGEGLGSVALTFLIISFAFPFVRRGVIFSRKYLPDPDFTEMKKQIQELYRMSKKPLFYLHVITNAGVVSFGLLHGLTVELESWGQAYSGIIALTILIVLSISGLLMWIRFKPFWDKKETRKAIRWLHSQWILTALAIFFLFLHVGIGD